MSGTEPHVHGGLNKVSHIDGGLKDPAQVTDDPKRECTPKTKLALLCALGAIVVSGCVAGVLALLKEHEPTIAEGHSGLHKWTCGETTFDLLIDGDSVKLGPKIFTQREIALLHDSNGDSNVTTYTIFNNIDA